MVVLRELDVHVELIADVVTEVIIDAAEVVDIGTDDIERLCILHILVQNVIEACSVCKTGKHIGICERHELFVLLTHDVVGFDLLVIAFVELFVHFYLAFLREIDDRDGDDIDGTGGSTRK